MLSKLKNLGRISRSSVRTLAAYTAGLLTIVSITYAVSSATTLTPGSILTADNWNAVVNQVNKIGTITAGKTCVADAAGTGFDCTATPAAPAAAGVEIFVNSTEDVYGQPQAVPFNADTCESGDTHVGHTKFICPPDVEKTCIDVEGENGQIYSGRQVTCKIAKVFAPTAAPAPAAAPAPTSCPAGVVDPNVDISYGRTTTLALTSEPIGTRKYATADFACSPGGGPCCIYRLYSCGSSGSWAPADSNGFGVSAYPCSQAIPNPYPA